MKKSRLSIGLSLGGGVSVVCLTVQRLGQEHQSAQAVTDNRCVAFGLLQQLGPYAGRIGIVPASR